MKAEPDLRQGISPAPRTSSNGLIERSKEFYRITTSLVPARLRWAIVGVAVFAIGVVLYSSSHPAKLRVMGHHAFRNVAVSVAVDGKPAFADQIAGTTKKRLGVLSRIEGSFSRTLKIEPGEHMIAVRMISPTDHFDQTKQCAVKVAPGQESTLVVSAGRGGMWLQFQGGAPNLPPASPVGDYVGYLRSLLLTMGGSALSAAIAFIVQDLLKSRKAEVPGPPQSSQAPSCAP